MNRYSIRAAALAAMCASAPSLAFAGDAPQGGSVGFLVSSALGVTSATQLDGAVVCVVFDSLAEILVTQYFEARGMMFEPALFETERASLDGYEQAVCDVFASDTTTVQEAQRAAAVPSEHIVLPETLPETQQQAAPSK